MILIFLVGAGLLLGFFIGYAGGMLRATTIVNDVWTKALQNKVTVSRALMIIVALLLVCTIPALRPRK